MEDSAKELLSSRTIDQDIEEEQKIAYLDYAMSE